MDSRLPHSQSAFDRFARPMWEKGLSGLSWRGLTNTSLHPKYPALLSFVFFWNVPGSCCSDLTHLNLFLWPCQVSRLFEQLKTTATHDRRNDADENDSTKRRGSEEARRGEEVSLNTPLTDQKALKKHTLCITISIHNHKHTLRKRHGFPGLISAPLHMSKRSTQGSVCPRPRPPKT